MGLGILISVDNAPNEKLTQQVSQVEVYEKMDNATTYKIRFMVDICDRDIAKGLEEQTDPGSMLGVLVEVKGELVCLVSGPVARQQAHLQHGGAGSWIEVEGTDTSQAMDQGHRTRSWEDATDSDIATSILGDHQLRTDVESTPDSAHLEENHSLVQHESDLSLIRRLARRNGMHFWITYDPDGTATGHFKSRSLEGQPVAELMVNLAENNIENLRINWDVRRPTQVEGQQLDLRTKEVMGGPVTLNGEGSLGAQGLAQIAGSQAHTTQLAPPADDGGTMQTRARALLREAQWFIQASCHTSMHRLCNKLIRSHTVVEVQGAGSRYSGKYYVTGVKHLIDAVSHGMEVELARNAWGNEASGAQGLSGLIP